MVSQCQPCATQGVVGLALVKVSSDATLNYTTVKSPLISAELTV